MTTFYLWIQVGMTSYRPLAMAGGKGEWAFREHCLHARHGARLAMPFPEFPPWPNEAVVILILYMRF